MKKIFLEFKQTEFNNAKALFEKKQLSKNQMYTELALLLNATVEPSESIENDPLQYYYDWLLEQYKDRNPMNLNAHKLIDLLEIDLLKFKDLTAKNKAVLEVQEPIEEAFKIYAETPEELARLKLATDLVAVIQRTKKICGFVNLSSLKPIIIYDGATNEYAVNNEFVKSKYYTNVL